MAETFEAYRTRVLSYLGDEEPIGVQQATPSQLESRLRHVAPEELIRRPTPEKWSIAEIVAHLADAGWPWVAIAKHAGESGRGLNVVGIRPYGRASRGRRSKMRAFRQGSLGRRARATCDCWSRSRAHGGWKCYGVHQVRGRQTVEEFVRLEAAHDLNHLRQIDRILGGCM